MGWDEGMAFTGSLYGCDIMLMCDIIRYRQTYGILLTSISDKYIVEACQSGWV